MTPATLMMFVMASWRIGADLQLATEFPIDSGLWSHWHIWIACALLSHLTSVILNRYGRTGETGIVRSVAHGMASLFGRPDHKSVPARQSTTPVRSGD
jgi:hypothetical protein